MSSAHFPQTPAPSSLDSFDLAETARPTVAAARRIVIKLGTRVLTDPQGFLASARVSALVATAAAARRGGREVVLVSSGALGLGCKVLGYEKPPKRPEQRRACAAVGQAQLMSLYEHRFGLHGLICGQVLVGEGDFAHRERNLHLRSTLDALLQSGVVPVLNENDAIAGETVVSHDGEQRPVFRENDRLAALVAGALKADLLVLLTDVPGVFDLDPNRHSDARLLATFDPSWELEGLTDSPSALSRGGMRSKVDAALIASRGGCQAVIACGLEAGTLSHLMAGDAAGTWFPASGKLDARDRWIAYSTASRGALHLDAGAVDALRLRQASLMIAGVTRLEGKFQPGDVIELRGPDGRRIGRGQIRFDAATVGRWLQGEAPLEAAGQKTLIRRNFIVLSPEAEA